jgi:hypothetical protein
MPNRAAAMALIARLQRAETVVHDLFLEATDDGIEALEAILEASRKAVLERGENGGRRDRRRRRRPDAQH